MEPDLEAAVASALASHMPHVWPDAPPDGAALQAGFCAALARANETINLTGITEPRAMALRHVADSLIALPDVEGPGPLVDLGSGCGVPGIPLALALPDRQVVLVESRQRKAAAIAALVDELGLAPRVTAVRARGEAWLADQEACTVVSRAVGSVADQLKLLWPVRAHVGALVMLKGPAADDELAAAARWINADRWPRPTRRDVDLPDGEGRRVVLRFG